MGRPALQEDVVLGAARRGAGKSDGLRGQWVRSSTAAPGSGRISRHTGAAWEGSPRIPVTRKAPLGLLLALGFLET